MPGSLLIKAARGKETGLPMQPGRSAAPCSRRTFGKLSSVPVSRGLAKAYLKDVILHRLLYKLDSGIGKMKNSYLCVGKSGKYMDKIHIIP